MPRDRRLVLGSLLLLPGLFGRTSMAAQPGYSIPIVDISGQKSRQVVVDREKGQYLGHPTTVLLEDGKAMLIVYPKGHGKGPIVYKRSTDGGRTWTGRLPTPENWATSKETPTIHRITRPDGSKRLLMFSGLYPIRIARSDDDGKSWTPLEPIGDFGGIVAMGSLETLKNGDLMALFHDDGRFLRNSGKTGPFVVYKTISRDSGLTWSQPVAIARHPSAHLCEPGLIRSPDGKQIAVLLRENSRKMNSFLILSDDEGRTWTEPKELPGSLTGDRHVGKYAKDGRLFISFRDTTRQSPTKGDWVAWVGTYEDIINGREGQYRVRLMDNTKGADCAYPGVEVLPDGTIVTTTYGHWEPGEAPYIVSVRLRLDELDRARKESKSANSAFAPTSSYERQTIEGWPIMVRKEFLRDQPELAARTLKRLREQLKQIVERLPAGPVMSLKKIMIWVEENDPHHPCMAYHPDPNWLRDHGMNPDKARCVELANARNFLSWTREQPWMVLHELAHGYHHQFLMGGYNAKDVAGCYDAAKTAGTYESVKRYNGRTERAYALNNPMEYFAEATEAYFGVNDFYPFNRAELKSHDPRAFALLGRIWQDTSN